MSLTPVDESDARGPSGDGPAERPEPGLSLSARVGRAAERLRAACRRVVRGLRAAAGGSDPDPRPDGGSDAEETPRLKRFSEARTDPPACPSVAGLPARERPLTFPARGADVDNRPDLVVRQTDDEMVVAVPGEPSTTIRSDTWEPVEP